MVMTTEHLLRSHESHLMKIGWSGSSTWGVTPNGMKRRSKYQEEWSKNGLFHLWELVIHIPKLCPIWVAGQIISKTAYNCLERPNNYRKVQTVYHLKMVKHRVIYGVVVFVLAVAPAKPAIIPAKTPMLSAGAPKTLTGNH